MNRQTIPHDRTASSHDPAAPRPIQKQRARRLLGEILRGCTLGGAGLLLGGCSLPFGVAPLGIGLLAAASTYTWYIFAGLLASAFLFPVGLTSWAWVGIYAFCVVLRLCIRFFVDPPALPDGRPCRIVPYLRLCYASFLRNIGVEGHDTREDHLRMSYRGPEVRLFGEHPFLRMLTAAVTGFIAGLFGMLTGGFHVYDLLGTLLLLGASPVFTFLSVAVFGEAGLILLFSPTPLRDAPLSESSLRGKAFSDRDGGMSRLCAHFRVLPLAAVATLAAATVYAARTHAIPLGTPYLTVSLSTLLALVISLTAAARLGVVPGVAVAVICGTAAGVRTAPIFILAAGGYALLRYLSHRAGILGGCTAAAVFCVAVEGLETFMIHFPAILLGMPLCFLTERIGRAFPLAEARPHADREVDDFTASVTAALTAETRVEAQRARLTALSEAFGALSRRFSGLSGQLKHPRTADLRRICDESFGQSCARCRQRDICWGPEYHRTLDLQSHLVAILRDRGRIVSDYLPEDLLDACPYMDTIAEDLNARYARLTEALARTEKTEIIANDYAAMATLLGDALDADRLDNETMGGNRDTANRIYDYLTEQGVAVHGVVVTGRRENGRRRVIARGEGLEQLTDKLDMLRTDMEEICGTRLSDPVFDIPSSGGAVTMTLAPKARLSTTYAGSTVPAGHDPRAPYPAPLTSDTPSDTYTPPSICGDHVALFHTGDAYFYALISDGMGSGEEASLTSEICISFLEKMLSGGGQAELSLRMLDTCLHAKNTGTGEECSATVDLMELDLMDGHAVFSKNGAAPTYVVREGTVYKLRSRSMPLGILRNTPPELLRFRTHPGDVVVMVSDGVTQGEDECPWLMELLSAPMPENMDSLRIDIIRRALSSGSEDDLSAIAIRVEEQS